MFSCVFYRLVHIATLGNLECDIEFWSACFWTSVMSRRGLLVALGQLIRIRVWALAWGLGIRV